MTLNNLKLTSHIVDKFAEQVIPTSNLRINSEEVFSDKMIRVTDHALGRLNERLNLKKEKMEYAQFIRSRIYGQKKIMATYKNHDIFICDVAFGGVDLTIILKRQEEYYALITAYINSTERFVEFMKKEFKQEEKEHQIDKILKDSLFGGRSSAEFFKDFEETNHLSLIQENTKPTKTRKIKKENKFHKQELNDELMERLLKEVDLPDFSIEKPIQEPNKNQQKPRVKVAKTKLNNEVYQQAYDDKYMEDLLGENTLVQQSVEDIVPSEPTCQENYIAEEDRETKVPEQKEVHKQELNEDLMNELLGDFAD